MITNSMEPEQESELVSLVEDYANEIRAWDKKQIGADVTKVRQDIVDYVGSLLAAKDAEIEVTVQEWEDRIILTSGGYELVVMKDLEDSSVIRFTGVSVRTMKDLTACHALLTRARKIIAERG